MPYDGNGNFTRNYNWVNDAALAINILPDRMDADSDDFASGLSLAITRDGQGAPTANITWNNFKLTNLGNATVALDALNLGTADGRYIKIDGSSTITANVSMGGYKITDLGNATAAGDALSMGFADTRYLALSGGTMTGSINSNGFAITNAPTPSASGDVANKSYVDAVAAAGSAAVSLVTTTIITQYLGGF